MSAEDQSDVLVAMAVYNGESTVEAAIASVLAQTHEDWVLSIVDDASTDGTPQILQRYADHPRILVHRNAENRGLALSRQGAVAATDSHYVAFLDADDAFNPAFLVRAMEAFRDNIHCDIVKLGVQPDRTMPEPYRISLQNTILMNRVMKRAVFDFIGAYRNPTVFTNPYGGEDAVFNTVANHFFNVFALQDRLYNYHVHRNSHVLRFMDRTELHDGEIIFPTGMTEHDRRIKDELHHLLEACKQKARLKILSSQSTPDTTV